MDPLSVAASIAGLVTLADALFRGVYKYYKTVSDASQEIEELVNRLKSLAGILHSLKILADALEQDGTQTTIQLSHVSDAAKVLGEIQERLGKSQSKRGSSKLEILQQSLKWPITKTKTKELTEKLSQQQNVISLALESDSLINLVKLLNDNKDVKAQLSSVQVGVQNLQMLTRVEVDATRQRILDFFLKVNPQPNLDTSIKLRHPGTGNWLTESLQFQQWIETAGSKMWLSGIPGAGKTVLAGAVIQRALEKGNSSPTVGVAFFFCDYKDPKATILSNILGAMASQLARQNDQAFGELEKLFESLHPRAELPKDADSDVLQDCLEEMFKCFSQIIIIVDGLDECGDSADKVTQVLTNIANYSTNVTMALLSRDEYTIDIKLRDDFTKIEVRARREDILLYVGSEIDRRIEDRTLRTNNIALKDEILRRLCNEADGMFRWVTCQLDYICGCPTDADRRAALQELPPTLHATYERMLRRLNRGNPRVQRIVQKCLQLIAIKSVKIGIYHLRYAVSVPDTLTATLEEEHIIGEEEISFLCSSFIRKSEDGIQFEFSHFTVREYLERETLLNDCELAGYYLSAALPTELINSLFHPLKTPAFKYWAIYLVARHISQNRSPDIEYIRRATSLVLDPTFRTIHLAATLDLPETCEHLIRADAKWNTVSTIGTPLECSITRMASLLDKSAQVSRDLTKIRNTWAGEMYATHRPGQAIAVLGTAGSDIQHPPQRFGEWSLMMCAIFSSIGSLDFSPISSLICMGWVVSDEEATGFEESMAFVAQHYPNGSLNRFRVVNSNPGYRMCATAWNTAVHLEFDFTEDTTLMDTRVTLSLESFARKCKIAISNDDVELVQAYLEDGRITSPETDDDGAETCGYSLLRQAMREGSVKTLRLLIHRGYSVNKTLSDGVLPIYALSGKEGAIGLLLESGASHLDRDLHGRTIWHLAAKIFQCDTISALLNLTGDAKIGALQMQDNEGYTPLTLAIEGSTSANKDRIENATATIKLLLDACKADPLCWSCNQSPWDLAARSGSAAVLQCLEASGIPPDPVQNGQRTPLHVIGEQASKECAELMVKLFPSAQDLQHEGMFSVECFIYRCMLQATIPQRGVIETLAHDDIPVNLVQKKASLWKYFCAHIAGSELGVFDFNKAVPVFNFIFDYLFRRNVFEAYEESTSQSALIPLFLGMIHGNLIITLIGDNLKKLITCTKFWVSARLATETIEYVKFLITELTRRSSPFTIETIHILLVNGVDVHQRSDSSILEAACKALECGERDGTNPEAASSLHLAQRRIFEEIVDSARPEQLNATQSSASRCLQHLAEKGNHSGSSWMVETLVRRGLDPNKSRIGPDKDPPLVYCLLYNATPAALMLLRLGADPRMVSFAGSFNALHAAALTGHLDFLSSLSSKVEGDSMKLIWQTTANVRQKIELLFQNFDSLNAFHVASINGHVKCIQFFMDNQLSLKLTSTTTGGYNCLHFSAINGHSETIKYLYSLGLDINQSAHDGSLPIHFAARNGHGSAVGTLVQLGSATPSDGFGMTPQMYAKKLGYNHIYESLAEIETDGQLYSTVNTNKDHAGSWKHLLTALESAIRLGDLETCERLHTQGCPLDFPMSSCGGCSPLIVAILSACKRLNRESTLYLAIKDRRSTAYLDQFLDIVLESAWDIESLGNPILFSVENRNQGNLNLVVGHIKRNLDKYSILTGSLQEKVLENMVNKKSDNGDSPLHLATYNGDFDIVETLLDAGADVDALDSNNLTPIQVTGNQSIIACLSAAGSKIGWLDSTLWSLTTGDPIHLENATEFHRWAVNSRNIPVPINDMFDPDIPSRLGPKLIGSLLHLGINMNRIDHSQRTMMHWALCNERSSSYLLSLPQIIDCKAFPWHTIGYQLQHIPWINKHWRLFKRRIPFADLQRMMNLHPEHGISPLCQAAAIDALEVIDRCLEMGASIDFEGMAACANCRLKAVKHLVRRGASIVYHGDFGLTSAIEMANGHKKIIAWLLVRQFTEQQKLEYPVSQDPTSVPPVRP
ncbi:hypothetical protein GGS24DRAFT_503531 [Hypoxylon argillaceum]|nr:hypothetical protein GGS24DRAFT_503531 [Hypoxylon argillaceum]